MPVGAELCGPCFTPDDETLFVAVQHPAEGGSAERSPTFEEPIDALARLQARHAAAAVGGRHHQTRRRQDRDVERTRQRTTSRADGLWGVETEGPGRGTSKHFYRVPVGAELCGPCFTPDDETLFVAVQHPAEEESSGEPSNFEEPSTRWPDFKPGMPPRPSVVVITKRGGGKIGT